MTRVLASLLFAFVSTVALAQGYKPGVQVGVITGTNGAPTANVAFVTPTPTTQVLQCTAAFQNTCWPSLAGTSTAAALGSLPATGSVWAIVPPATTGAWVSVASITATVGTPPPIATPTTPVTVPITSASAVVTWPAPTTDASGAALTATLTYNVYDGIATPATQLATGLAGTSYTATNLANGSHPLYVTAVDSGGESAPSPTITVIVSVTPVAKPGAPGKPNVTCVGPAGTTCTIVN